MIKMTSKPISPTQHALLDYALVGSLLILPTVLNLSPTVKKVYTTEAWVLLGYVAITDHPLAVKPLIPFQVHGQIDPFNVMGFALQTFLGPFSRSKGATAFNIGFTLLSGITVAWTNWKGGYQK
ncbi:hypothetical protein [Larkinella terrae]|uniref:Uncharacterized protein n=1 Tax=Larkinella terrae TaxID=2025311 RepID=A0A7K0EVC9_9BACT|nr:hypothetical protein [Larkinella terrae]MRS65773.1 hypothetical protein [Larkinella terrae]